MNDLLQLRIRKIIRETPGTLSLELENTAGSIPTYQAGQFLTFLLDINGKELRRSYSLHSAPGIDPCLAVTIQRVENGEVSRYLFDHIKEGDTLTSLYPAGRFVLPSDPAEKKDLFLIGGGSGVTPLFALLKAALKEMPQWRISLFYSNRRESSAIFYRQLNELQSAYPDHFSLVYFFSDPARKTPPGTLPLAISGRLNNALLEQFVEHALHFEKENAAFFLCGPPGLMRMAQLTLTFMGFRGDQIRRENFVSPVITAPIPVPAGSGLTSMATLHFRGKQYMIKIPPGENILQAALDAGISIPYSCRGGLCAACSGLCTKGKVKMLINEVLTEQDIASGKVLTCVGIPGSEELEINFD